MATCQNVFCRSYAASKIQLTSIPPQPLMLFLPERNTVWTKCSWCNMQFQCSTVYLQKLLICVRCHSSFLATEETSVSWQTVLKDPSSEVKFLSPMDFAKLSLFYFSYFPETGKVQRDGGNMSNESGHLQSWAISMWFSTSISLSSASMIWTGSEGRAAGQCSKKTPEGAFGSSKVMTYDIFQDSVI
ncbi:unnamed protein product [Cuscuta epithymum]|uniref:Uncharacterized protein n=1 Tax=Cuscuta epithymum TaxID=186058 RepID=A0AAV0BZ38_9ASTE|nr:unnamed protein product [Cuscuta epithymum]